MVQVLVETVTVNGKRGFGWRPTCIALHPVVCIDTEDGTESCAVRFDAVTWG